MGFDFKPESDARVQERLDETTAQLSQIARQIQTPGIGVLAIGDSIVINTSYQPDRSYGPGWFESSAYKSKKAKIIANMGVAGNTTTQMLARFDADVLAYHPNVVFIQGGTNDLGASVAKETIASNLEKMVIKAKSAGIVPVLMSVLPRNNATINTECAKLNLLISKLARAYGILMIDIASTMTDPITGYMIAAYTSDGIHPNTGGQAVISDAVVAQFYAYIPPQQPMLVCSNVDATNMITNGLFCTDSNTDGTPNDWDVGGTGGVVSLVADSSIVGNWLKIVKSTTASFYLAQSVPLSKGYAVGDTLRISFLAKSANNVSGGLKFKVQFVCSGGSTIGAVPMFDWIVDITNPMQVCLDFVVPVGTTTATLYIAANDGTGDVYIAQMGVINLTAINAA